MNINPNPQRSLSQKKRILRFLESGHTLTPLDALQYFGTMKLGTRISELISEGYDIKKKMVTVFTVGGKTARVMSYSIAK